MTPAAKALWFIETHFAHEIDLQDVANSAGVSRYHMSRAFGLATGYTVMRYVRGRRLTEAARSLTGGASDILTVAIEAGYNSHEAFTRAFRDLFGVTPETVRARRNLNHTQLTEAIRMNEALLTELEPPRFENGRTLLIAGLSERYSMATTAGIPAQWQRFVPHLGHIPGQTGHVTYGVVSNSDEAGNMDYLCGVEVSDSAKLPAKWSSVRIPEHRYAIFTHRAHISAIQKTWYTIFNKWLPDSGYSLAEAPELERYDERFNPSTGSGVLEIWIPVTPSSSTPSPASPA